MIGDEYEVTRLHRLIKLVAMLKRHKVAAHVIAIFEKQIATY